MHNVLPTDAQNLQNSLTAFDKLCKFIDNTTFLFYYCWRFGIQLWLS